MALSDSLVAYYSLEEASGNALDAHGSLTLTDNNTVGAATGKVNGARDFERDNSEYFSRASASQFNFGDADFTVQAWINVESGAPGSEEGFITLHDGGSLRVWGLTTDNGPFRFRVRASTTQYDLVNTNGGNISTGTWYCVHFWHDSVNNLLGISRNAGTANTVSHTAGINTASNPIFWLGQEVNGRFFDGLMDEVAIWSRVLTSDERTELYNSGNGRDYAYITGGAATKAIYPFRRRTRFFRRAG